MPDPVPEGIGSATPGRYGTGSAQLVLSETTIAAAWNVQGIATQPRFVEEVQRLFDVALPTAPNTTAKGTTLTAFWLGPRSWLLVAGGPFAAPDLDFSGSRPAPTPVQPRATPASPLTDFAGKRDALNGLGAALFDLSASRVAYTLTGPHAATVLASGCPLDLHPRVFPAGACAQSVFGHVNALVHKPDATLSFTLMVARSFGRDVWQALCAAAAHHGYEVGCSTPFH